jgi:clan AA aspartic protease
MGHLHSRVKISADKSATVRMFVDTGATYSVISKELAQAIGFTAERSTTMELANGRRVRVKIGIAVFEIGDRKGPAPLVVANVPEPILGVETLEVLGLAVDPKRGRLMPTRSWTARLPIFR